MNNGPEFFQTIMGHKFYDGTMPELVRQLKRLNENLDMLIGSNVMVADLKKELLVLGEENTRLRGLTTGGTNGPPR